MNGNDIVLAQATVSRRHAAIDYGPDGCKIIDLGSTNGTFVNGRKVTQATIIRDRDEIRFGTARFVLRCPESAGLDRRASRGRRRARLAGITAIFAAALALTFFYRRLEQPSGPATHKRVRPTPETAPPWLNQVNHYRALAKLAPVGEDPALSKADLAHARYLRENFGEAIKNGINIGPGMHTEDKSRTGYSAEGLVAARNADVAMAARFDTDMNPAWAIDFWMSAPFHRMAILNPGLHRVGYGQDCGGEVCVAALNIMTDADPPAYRGKMLPAPVMFPPDGSTVDLRASGGEWPNPLSACRDYTDPAGLAITLQLGSWVTPKLEEFSLTSAGAPIESCGFDADSYVNPDTFTQQSGRQSLKNYGAVIVIPRNPLKPGNRYKLSVAAGGDIHVWTFGVR